MVINNGCFHEINNQNLGIIGKTTKQTQCHEKPMGKNLRLQRINKEY
jgi:hypothetical protein